MRTIAFFEMGINLGTDSLKRVLFLQNSGSERSASGVDRLFERQGLAVDYRWAPNGQLPDDVRAYDGIFISGGPNSAYDETAFIRAERELVRQAQEDGVPTLGVCLGCQLIAAALCGQNQVYRRDRCEVGYVSLRLEAAASSDPLLKELATDLRMFVWHNDDILPDHPNMQVLAGSADSAVHIWRFRDSAIWGIQGHPEVPWPEPGRWFEEHRPGLTTDGVDVTSLIAEAEDTSAARSLIECFARLCANQ